VILVTVHIGSVLQEVLKTVSVLMVVGPDPRETIQEFSNMTGILKSPNIGLPSSRDETSVWFLDERKIVPVRVRPTATDARRHKRKYAEGQLPEERNFVFKGPAGKLNLRAHNLMIFVQMAEGVDDETWIYHLRRGEYSRWLRDEIKDKTLADEVRQIERKLDIGAAESRKLVLEAIQKAYTAPA
jgi:hypothetical protein